MSSTGGAERVYPLGHDKNFSKSHELDATKVKVSFLKIRLWENWIKLQVLLNKSSTDPASETWQSLEAKTKSFVPFIKYLNS